MNILNAVLAAQRGCVLNFLLVDVAGDLVSGLLLGRIIYWFSPDSRGVPRVRIKRDGKLWLAKARADWWGEIRITEDQYDRAIKGLVELGVVEVRNLHFAGKKTPHIWLNTARLEEVVSREVETYSLDTEEVGIDGADNVDDTDLCSFCKSEKAVSEDPKHRCKYCFVCDAWVHYFPNKPKPDRKAASLRKLINARWADNEFRQFFHQALARASLSGVLQENEWFDMYFFLSKKDGRANWRKILDKFYDSHDRDRYKEHYARLMQFDGVAGRTPYVSQMG